MTSKPPYSVNENVLCGIFQVGIVGSCFIDEGGTGVTVDSERHVQILRNLFRTHFFCPMLLWNRHGTYKYCWNQMEPQSTRLKNLQQLLEKCLYISQHLIRRFRHLHWPV